MTNLPRYYFLQIFFHFLIQLFHLTAYGLSFWPLFPNLLTLSNLFFSISFFSSLFFNLFSLTYSLRSIFFNLLLLTFSFQLFPLIFSLSFFSSISSICIFPFVIFFSYLFPQSFLLYLCFSTCFLWSTLLDLLISNSFLQFFHFSLFFLIFSFQFSYWSFFNLLGNLFTLIWISSLFKYFFWQTSSNIYLPNISLKFFFLTSFLWLSHLTFYKLNSHFTSFDNCFLFT